MFFAVYCIILIFSTILRSSLTLFLTFMDILGYRIILNITLIFVISFIYYNVFYLNHNSFYVNSSRGPYISFSGPFLPSIVTPPIYLLSLTFKTRHPCFLPSSQWRGSPSLVVHLWPFSPSEQVGFNLSVFPTSVPFLLPLYGKKNERCDVRRRSDIETGLDRTSLAYSLGPFTSDIPSRDDTMVYSLPFPSLPVLPFLSTSWPDMLNLLWKMLFLTDSVFN